MVIDCAWKGSQCIIHKDPCLKVNRYPGRLFFLFHQLDVIVLVQELPRDPKQDNKRKRRGPFPLLLFIPLYANQLQAKNFWLDDNERVYKDFKASLLEESFRTLKLPIMDFLEKEK